MKIKITTLCVVAAIFFISCSSEDECFTADSVKLIKTFNEDGRDISVFLRTSGFQEKEMFYELYESTPVFDRCGKPDTLPVSSAHVDSAEGKISKLLIDGNRLNIIYEAGGGREIDLNEISIEIRRR